MLNEFLKRIPKGEADLKIGPLLLWVSGYNDISQTNPGDLSYIRTPTLLNNENIIVFSEMSDTPIFDLKNFLKDLHTMYDNIKVEQVVELASCDSEFGLKLTSDGLGQIRIDIVYNAWGSNGNLKFEHKIDQSYLPKIIYDLKIILAKYE